MHQFNFEELENIKDIAKALGCQQQLVECVLDYPANSYTQLRIPRKRRLEPRIVYKVDDKLKNIHKNILTSIAAKVDFPEYVQGFVSKRSIATNASLHLGRKYILNLDIKDFFESIKIDKITQVFKELGCRNQEVALIFARLCTFNESLVQGANTSPILANLVCTELDKNLVKIGQDYDCAYSRYADDIAFSGDKVPKNKEIINCLKLYDFQVNSDKWKCQSRGKSQYVTGLTVFDTVRPRLPKKMKKQLRQELYYAYKYGLENHLDKTSDINVVDFDIHKIDGLIAFMYSIEPERAYQFDTIWQAILTKENLEPSRNPSKILKKWQDKRSLNYPSRVEYNVEEVETSTQVH